jgi:hypothetical protein
MKNQQSRGDEVYTDDVFQILLEYEVSRSVRYPTPLGILHIEMAAAGSNPTAPQVAARIFSSALNTHLRSVDIPSGAGREYRILLPTATEAGVRSVCERLLFVFRNKFNAPDGSSIAFSLNIGATAHPGGSTLRRDLLLEKAEAALKQSKTRGPNTFALVS